MTEKRFTMAEDEYTIEDNSKIISVMTREDILFTLNRLNDENEQLNEIKERYDETIVDWNALKSKYDDLKNENEQLKTTIEELRAYDKRDYIESEHINNIYKEFGFDGVIEEVKGRLVYGTVTEMDNLVRISTGGWSDDEALLDILISPMTRFHYHYVGYLVGGAFYFDKDKSFESFMKIRLIKDLEKGDKDDWENIV